MKVVFLGAHGTGKSTASSHLAALMKAHDRKNSVKVIEENARKIAKLTNGDMNNKQFQRLAFVDHLKEEFTAELLHNVVICDRSALDTLIYGLVYKVELPSEYFSLALNHLNSFNKVFFMRPSNDEITDDGFRDTNIETRRKIDEEFERFLKLWGGPYTEIRTDDVFKHDYLGELVHA